MLLFEIKLSKPDDCYWKSFWPGILPYAKIKHKSLQGRKLNETVPPDDSSNGRYFNLLRLHQTGIGLCYRRKWYSEYHLFNCGRRSGWKACRYPAFNRCR